MVDPAHWPWHRPTGWPYQRHLDCIWKASSIHRHPGDDVHRPRRNPGDFPGLPRAEFQVGEHAGFQSVPVWNWGSRASHTYRDDGTGRCDLLVHSEPDGHWSVHVRRRRKRRGSSSVRASRAESPDHGVHAFWVVCRFGRVGDDWPLVISPASSSGWLRT